MERLSALDPAILTLAEKQSLADASHRELTKKERGWLYKLLSEPGLVDRLLHDFVHGGSRECLNGTTESWPAATLNTEGCLIASCAPVR